MRLLLVEDNARLCELVRRALAAEGFAVDIAQTLRTAEEFLERAPYDLIVLDLGLPDGDGLTLLRTLRGRAEAVPVLVMTARSGLDDRILGLDLGADDYLIKPFATGELAARCRALLRRPGGVLGSMLTAGNLTLDSNTRRATVAGTAIEIPPRELSLLELLLRRSGQVVARANLENGLYAMGEEVSANALEAAVSRLRRRLAAAGAEVTIHTAHGIGYALAPKQPES
ncbi:MAG: response regulator [Alphaproteobacteria bacterium]|nr:response regulator [Alphaproteobacteria bacterium]MBU6472668.1 response regulator [Alphaproteobacteria bacterium]MDE2011374.1 response regulator [Alphaproteobacteria bacterium]MDE2072894.1 response regulator [Alphaproteobacteria bacterium]MDE2352433.1 response regulator [Alphaproteobacteria bacterium]